MEYERDGFKWDTIQQSHVLGSFFWIHWVTQLPGGILAAKYGTKIVFGFSNFIACVMCIFMPILCYIDYRYMVWLRLVQGFITGLAWPAMHHLTGQWIPPNERSKFISAYLGSSIGVAIAYPIFGFIMKASSWEWVYHACGICGTVWYAFWLYFVSSKLSNFEWNETVHDFPKRFMIHRKSTHAFTPKKRNTFFRLSDHRSCEATTKSEQCHGEPFSHRSSFGSTL